MSEKIGPYGSHYGTGCYTRDCSLRSASSAGVVPPISYSDAQKNLQQAFANNMTAKGRNGFQKSENEVAEAKLALNSTKEGLKALTQHYAAEKKKSGPNSAATLMLQEQLDAAKKNHARIESGFKKEIFDASTKVTPKDLRGLAEYSTRFVYDKENKSLRDTYSGDKIVASVDSDGGLRVNNSASSKLSSKAYPGDANYEIYKQEISETISADTSRTISIMPTATSRLNDELKENYNVKRNFKADGSYTAIIKDKDTDKPLARIHYNVNGQFDNADWANSSNDGSIVWPQTSNITVLRMLKNKEFTKRPPLPSHLVD